MRAALAALIQDRMKAESEALGSGCASKEKCTLQRPAACRRWRLAPAVGRDLLHLDSLVGKLDLQYKHLTKITAQYGQTGPARISDVHTRPDELHSPFLQQEEPVAYRLSLSISQRRVHCEGIECRALGFSSTSRGNQGL